MRERTYLVYGKFTSNNVEDMVDELADLIVQMSRTMQEQGRFDPRLLRLARELREIRDE